MQQKPEALDYHYSLLLLLLLLLPLLERYYYSCYNYYHCCKLLMHTAVALAPCHVSIDGREGVIHYINVRVRIRRPGYRNPLFLSSRKVDALLPNLGHISGGKLAHIL